MCEIFPDAYVLEVSYGGADGLTATYEYADNVAQYLHTSNAGLLTFLNRFALKIQQVIFPPLGVAISGKFQVPCVALFRLSDYTDYKVVQRELQRALTSWNSTASMLAAIEAHHHILAVKVITSSAGAQWVADVLKMLTQAQQRRASRVAAVAPAMSTKKVEASSALAGQHRLTMKVNVVWHIHGKLCV